jgi:putative endonuclease
MLSAATDLVARIAGRFSRLLNSRCRLTGLEGEPLDPQQIGRLGERIAAAWLRREGCRVLYRNFRAPTGGEVDLVVRDGVLLIFAEVKTRRAGGRGRPLDAVDREKEKLIERGANAWLKLLGTREIPWRFDVIEVILEEGEKPLVNRVQDAF